MAKDVITTTVDREIAEGARKADLKFGYLIARGWQVHNGEPQLVARLREAEDQIIRLQKANEKLQQIVLEMGR